MRRPACPPGTVRPAQKTAATDRRAPEGPDHRDRHPPGTAAVPARNRSPEPAGKLIWHLADLGTWRDPPSELDCELASTISASFSLRQSHTPGAFSIRFVDSRPRAISACSQAFA